MNGNMGCGVSERTSGASDVRKSVRVEHSISGKVNSSRGPFFDAKSVGGLVKPEIHTSDATRSMLHPVFLSVDVGITET